MCNTDRLDILSKVDKQIYNILAAPILHRGFCKAEQIRTQCRTIRHDNGLFSVEGMLAFLRLESLQMFSVVLGTY